MNQSNKQPLLLSAAYKLLASVFSYPNELTYEIMQKGLWKQVVYDLTEMGGITAATSETGEIELAGADTFWGQSLEEIQGLYTSVFDYAYPRPLCPPYAGIYLPGGNSYPGPRTELMGELGSRYYSWGLDLNEELSDHLAVELEFMHFLLAAENAAIEQDDYNSAKRLDEERQWFQAHLQEWIPTYSTCLAEHYPSLFWTNALELLKGLLECKGEQHWNEGN